MNTVQLVVLWYAVLVGAALLVIVPLGTEMSPGAVVLCLLTAVGLVAGTLIYSLSDRVRAHGRRVLLVVVGPILLGVAAWGLNSWSKTWMVEVPLEKITVTHATLGFSTSGTGQLVASFSNSSHRHVSQLVAVISVWDSTSHPIGGRVDTFAVSILPHSERVDYRRLVHVGLRKPPSAGWT